MGGGASEGDPREELDLSVSQHARVAGLGDPARSHALSGHAPQPPPAEVGAGGRGVADSADEGFVDRDGGGGVEKGDRAAGNQAVVVPFGAAGDALDSDAIGGAEARQRQSSSSSSIVSSSFSAAATPPSQSSSFSPPPPPPPRGGFWTGDWGPGGGGGNGG